MNHWRRNAGVALVAIVASIAGLLNDFVYDDVPLILENTRVHGLGHWREILTHAYWPPPFIEQLYRPVSSLWLAAEYTASGGHAIGFRLVSYMLYALTAVAMYRLASRLMTQDVALGIACIFAAHPVHVEAVALAVNQSELLVGLATILAATFYLDRRRGGQLSPRDWLVLVAVYATVSLTKENGLVLPGVLAAVELLVAGERNSAISIASWRPYLAFGAVAACVILARDAVVPGGVTVAVPARELRGLDLEHRGLLMLQVVPIWFRLLSWPAHLHADYGAPDVMLHHAFGLRESVGLAAVVSSACAVLFLWQRKPVVSFGVVWCAVALLPVSNLVPTGILVAERTLFLPSVGFLIAVGGLADWARTEWHWPRARRLLSVACAVLVVAGIVRSASRHHVWNRAHLRVVGGGLTPNR